MHQLVLVHELWRSSDFSDATIIIQISPKVRELHKKLAHRFKNKYINKQNI